MSDYPDETLGEVKARLRAQIETLPWPARADRHRDRAIARYFRN